MLYTILLAGLVAADPGFSPFSFNIEMQSEIPQTEYFSPTVTSLDFAGHTLADVASVDSFISGNYLHQFYIGMTVKFTDGQRYQLGSFEQFDVPLSTYLAIEIPPPDYWHIYSHVTITKVSVPQVLHAVPEPTTWAMMVGGFALAGSAMRRRKVSVAFA